MKKRQICPNIFIQYLIRGSLSDYFLVGKGKWPIIPTLAHIHPLKPIYISIS